MKELKTWFAALLFCALPAAVIVSFRDVAGIWAKALAAILLMAFCGCSVEFWEKCKESGKWRRVRMFFGGILCGPSVLASVIGLAVVVVPAAFNAVGEWNDRRWINAEMEKEQRRVSALEREALADFGVAIARGAIQSALSPSAKPSTPIGGQFDHPIFTQPQPIPNQPMLLRPALQPALPSGKIDTVAGRAWGNPEPANRVALSPFRLDTLNGGETPSVRDSPRGFSFHQLENSTFGGVHPKPGGQGFTVTENGRGVVADVYQKPMGQGYTVTQPGRGVVADIYEKPFGLGSTITEPGKGVVAEIREKPLGLGFTVTEPGRGVVADVSPKPGGGFTIREPGRGPTVEVSR